MTCREMDAILFSGSNRGELPPEAREHLATCESCRTLAGALGDAAAYELDPAVLERSRAHIPEDLKPVTPLAAPAVFTALFLLIAGLVAALAAWRKGIYGLPLLTVVQGAVVFGVLLAMLLLASFALAADMRPGARTVRGAWIFALGLAAVETVFLTLFSDYGLGRFLHQGIGCFSMGMTCSVVTALLAWLAVRRGYVVARVSTGATLGALSGLAGLAALELHCPVLLVPHLAIWHAAVFAVSAALGAAAGKVLQPRRNAEEPR